VQARNRAARLSSAARWAGVPVEIQRTTSPRAAGDADALLVPAGQTESTRRSLGVTTGP
jgi:hypothetical protein